MEGYGFCGFNLNFFFASDMRAAVPVKDGIASERGPSHSYSAHPF